MTSNSQETLLERVLTSTIWTLWLIIYFIITFSWWILRKIPKIIYIGLLIPYALLYAYENTQVLNPAVEEKAIIIFQQPTPTQQRLKELEGTDWSKADISWYLSEMATKYNVSESTMHTIVSGESQYDDMTRDGDMHITCERTGLPVRARGLVQITECYFPDVTDKEARNVPFALEFLAKNMSQGLGVMLWSTHPDRD